MKKYLFLIPVLIVMLLNCITFGQVAAADDGIDYSAFHKEPSEAAEVLSVFDFSSSDIDIPYNPHYDKYLYYVYSYKSLTDKYLSGQSDSISFYLYFFDFSVDNHSSDDISSVTNSMINGQSSKYTYSKQSGTVSCDYGGGSRAYLRFNKLSGFLEITGNKLELDQTTHYDPDVYVWVVDSNVDDFFYDNNSLNVEVRFKPALSGAVDRKNVDADGNISYQSNMRMVVINNSRFPIQYRMRSDKKNQVTTRPYGNPVGGNSSYDINDVQSSHQMVYDDDPVFVYYSNEWVYSTNIDSSTDWYNSIPQKQNKSSDWHYVSAGDSVGVAFNFTQINLVENEEYVVIVEAIRTDYDLASRMFVSKASSEAAYPDLKQLFTDDKQIVYQSEFSMVHYSDVKYDPNDTSNGVNPYKTYADGQQYAFSYNAKETEDGKVDYKANNVYTDKNSWWNSSLYEPDISQGSSGSIGSSSFSGLSNSFSSFFRFVNTTLGYFPSNVLTTFSLGMTAIVVVGILKAVFKQ